MQVHLVGTAPPRYPSHLLNDLRHVLTEAGHQVTTHLLGDLSLAEAAEAGARLAAGIGHRPSARSVVMHSLDEIAAVVALHARSTTAVPVVVRAESRHGQAGTARSRLIRQASLRTADAVVVPSKPDLRAVLAAGAVPDRMTVIPDPVCVPGRRRPTGSSGAGGRVVCLTGVGGAGELVAALRYAPRAELVVAGLSTPDQVHRLHAQAERLQVTERVSWHGWLPRERALELAACADLVAVPGLPGVRATTAIEAMGLGLPVVATAVPVLADAVVPGSTGVITPPGSPAAMGAALRRLLDDPFQLEAFGEAAHDRFAARYATGTVVRAIERVYDLLVGPAAGGDAVQPDLMEAV